MYQQTNQSSRQKTAAPAVLSVVSETILLVLPPLAFKVTAGLHLASHLFQPPHEASCHQRSLALSSTVHSQAHWGNTQPDTTASLSFYRFLIGLPEKELTACPGPNNHEFVLNLTTCEQYDTLDPGGWTEKSFTT